MVVVGIDPGMDTGFAVFRDAKLNALATYKPDALYAAIADTKPNLIVFEDSRLQRNIWPPPKLALQGKLNYARSVGYVDYQCRDIEAWCEAGGYSYIGISPKGKGSKMVDAKLFAQMTGWKGRTNQHVRDAALLAYRFRHGIMA